MIQYCQVPIAINFDDLKLKVVYYVQETMKFPLIMLIMYSKLVWPIWSSLTDSGFDWKMSGHKR